MGGESSLATAIKQRVLLRDITYLISEEGVIYNTWQVGQILREIGFKVLRSGGQQWVYPQSLDHIQEIGKSLDIEDTILND